MLARPDLVQAFEDEQVRRNKPDLHRNLRIVEALHHEARLLGAMPPTDPLEGIEVDIHLAEVINVRTAPGARRPSAR